MKPGLYRKIFKVLNEDLNMILSDDDFEEPEMFIYLIYRKTFYQTVF